MACPFNSPGDIALVLSTDPSNPTGKDLTSIASKFLYSFYILIIQFPILVLAERTYLTVTSKIPIRHFKTSSLSSSMEGQRRS